MSARLPDRIARSRVRMLHLAMVLKLVERGTVREAARALGMTQPAMTKALKELESLFDVPLFYRERKGLRPTPFCAPLERFARDVMYGLDEAFASVAQLLRGEEGRVSAGAVPGRALTLLSHAAARVQREHPQVNVCISADPSEELFRRLAAGEIDFALAARSPELDEQEFSFLAIGSEPMALVVAPAHRLLDLQPATMHDLAMQAWALPPRPDPARTRIEQAFGQRGEAPPQQLVETSGALATVEFVIHHGAVGVLDAGLAARLERAGIIATLKSTLPLQSASLGLVTLKRRRMRANAALVYRAVTEQIDADGVLRRQDVATFGLPELAGK